MIRRKYSLVFISFPFYCASQVPLSFPHVMWSLVLYILCQWPSKNINQVFLFYFCHFYFCQFATHYLSKKNKNLKWRENIESKKKKSKLITLNCSEWEKSHQPILRMFSSPLFAHSTLNPWQSGNGKPTIPKVSCPI